jgi:hypothetical protein
VPLKTYPCLLPCEKLGLTERRKTGFIRPIHWIMQSRIEEVFHEKTIPDCGGLDF